VLVLRGPVRGGQATSELQAGHTQPEEQVRRGPREARPRLTRQTAALLRTQRARLYL
jgi:hypothetical protein